MDDFERADAARLHEIALRLATAGADLYAVEVPISRVEKRRALEALGFDIAAPPAQFPLKRPTAPAPNSARSAAIDEWAAMPELEKLGHVRRVLGKIAGYLRQRHVDDFIARALLGDEKTALQAVIDFLSKLSPAERYAVAEFFLWRRAYGDHVRGAILRFAWETHSYAPFGTGLEQARDYFLEIPAQSLMDDWEVAHIASKGAFVRLFRGAAMEPGGIEATAAALSWTSQIEIAKFFASRALGHGYVLSVTVPRDAIIAFLISDMEFIIDPRPYFSTLRIH